MSQSKKEKLIAHSDEFRKEIIQITEGVWMSIGFSASNSAIIQGETGLILIDTHESTLAAEIVLAKYREIDQRPIHTIILTHEHRDHISGASVFAEGGNPAIISRPFTDGVMGAHELRDISRKRAERQFGMGLNTEERINIGLGPSERPIRGLAEGILPSTQFVTDERETHIIDGVKIEFVHAPGETPETMVVWLPEKRVLFGADNYYKSFPNLYAIRGNRYRDVQHWIDSLQRMINLNAEYLVPGHTRPLIGAGVVKATLTHYRAGIKSIFDQTVAGINRGLTPRELIETVKLPPEYVDLPYMQEFYGGIAWSVRSIFEGYLGWFDGNPTNLQPLTLLNEAIKMADLAGGEEKLLAKLQESVAGGQNQWALTLADHLILLGYDEAKELKARALVALAEDQANASARNWYIYCAKELMDDL
ncbi:MAG: alkyl sulfatase dimerization domain-containing protein [Anaerolineae bacterium]